MKNIYLSIILLLLVVVGSDVRAQDTLAIDNSMHYQTIEGWGHGGGILGFVSGAEYMLDSSVANPVNYQTLDFITSELGLTGSRTWEVGPRVDGTGIDSAGNCDVLDWAKFQSNTLSWQDAQYLVYFKNRVISEGYQPSFYSSPGYPTHATDQKPWIMYHPGERALQLWANSLYLKTTYGLEINYAVIYNEPAAPITSAILSDDIKALGPRFVSHGLSTMSQFAEAVAPLNDWNFITPVDSDATFWPYVGRLSYHNYGTADPYRSQIRDFGLFKGIRTAQTEMGSPSFDDLYADLTLGGVSYWEVAYSSNNTLVPSSGLTSFTPSSYYIRLRQVMHYVRPGAIRIGTAANDAMLAVLSFNQGGAITTVIDNKNAGAKTVFISGLPAGTYGLSSATPGATTFQEYGLQTVAAGGTLTVTANGGSSITTLYPRSLTNMPPTIMTWGTTPGYLVAPATTATLSAAASDPEAAPLTYLWTLVSSPAGSAPVIVSPATANTSVTGLSVAGTYVFNIAANDGVNISSKKVYICAYSSNPQPVFGSAGFRINTPYGLIFGNPGDTTHANIELPTSSATLQLGISDLANSDFTGRGTWSLVSQPAGGVAAVGATTYIFVSIRANVTGMTVPGDYVFQVNVTNPGFPDMTARIICSVHPATSAPVINSVTPFADTITLPVSSDLITAITTDPDGGLLRHWWEINAVPAGAYPVFDHQGLPISNVSNLTVPGTYTFTLRAFDDLHMTTRNVNIVVRAGVSIISGPSEVCNGSTIPLTDSTVGGIWTSSNPIIGTVSPGGIVTGISPGTTTITYTLGSASATTTITVNALPDAGTIMGATTICAGATTLLSDATTGGDWNSDSPGVAIVGITGIETGVAAGSAIISYSVTNGCGTAVAIMPVTVNPLPDAGTITGIANPCLGSTTLLSDIIAGGIWSSSAPGIATVDGTGIVTGAAIGVATISYSVTNGCGIAVATDMVTIDPLPAGGIATANTAMACTADAITLNDAGYTTTGTIYQWQSSPDNTTWSDVTGATTVPYTFTGLSADTYYRLTVTGTSCGIPVYSTGVLITYTTICACSGMSAGVVHPSVPAACPTTVISLNDLGYIAAGTTFQWQASLDSTTWTNIPATTVPYSFSGMTTTTWYRLMVSCIISGTSVVSAGEKILHVPCSGGGGTTNVAHTEVAQTVSIYPNPVTDELTIETNNTKYTSFTITNSIGQVIMQQDITAVQTKVNVQALPAGVYYVTLKGEENKEVQKFVKW